ncbi:hypothetical protein [Bacillus stercoris]|uniref:hypothetical protein n=1 Tax=Bacillus stercoris TaxID=2054641 RepID=UPI0024443503|nr:hypothetical protein [Bacillus stercoris]WGE38601.1 hypothetical protein QA442_19785 [Bacillus stercoris]
MNRQIIHLAVGKPKEYDWNHRKEMSAIGKSTVSSIELKKTGLLVMTLRTTNFTAALIEQYVYIHLSIILIGNECLTKK